MSLTPRQNELLVFIRAYVARNGRSPSFTEMLRAINLKSRCSISRMIDVLVREKYLARTNGDACSLKPLQTDDYHLANCNCDGCAKARYQRDLELVKAIQVVPKIAGCVEFIGLRPLGHLARLDWRYTDNSRRRRKPLLSRAQPLENVPHHDSVGAA